MRSRRRHRPRRSPDARASLHRPAGGAASPNAAELVPLKHPPARRRDPDLRAATSRLRIAIADPGNIHGIDELRLATQVSGRASASRAATRSSPSSRRSHAPVARCWRRSRRSTSSRSSRDGGRSRGRRRRLGRAARPARQLDHHAGRDRRGERHPLRAAGGRAARAGARRRRAQRGAADPEADGQRRHDPPEGAREARHRRAAQAAGRADLARTHAPSGACSTSASPCCRRSRASRS